MKAISSKSILFTIQITLAQLTEHAQRRHLLRFWLRDPENAWDTPEVLKERWALLYDDRAPESEVLPLEPYIRTAGNKSGRVG